MDNRQSITCPHCKDELNLIEDVSKTRCGHVICTNCIDYDVVSNCDICGIGLIDLMDFPELNVLKDTCGDLLYDLLWYQSISKAHEEESDNDAIIYLLSTSIINSIFSNMIVEGEEPEKSLRRVLEEEIKEIESLLDFKYLKPGPKPVGPKSVKR